MHNVILSEAKDLLEDNMQGHYYVYMMGRASGRALYVGVTNDLQRRVLEHKNGETAGFTRRYRCYALHYYEPYSDVRDAIAREKQIKGWVRERKERLIETMNPGRVDLAADF